MTLAKGTPMKMHLMATTSVALALLALAPVLQAQTTSDTTSTQDARSGSSTRLISTYTDFAGSPGNATSLVQGLESGTSVTLVPVGIQPLGTGPVTFTPAIRLSPGDTNIALALAQAELARAGISNPTPAQLEAALNGGSLTKADGTRVTLQGVLTERKSGMGWGQIANAMGVKLGALVSASKTEHAGTKEHAESQEHSHAKSMGKESAETLRSNRAAESSRSDNSAASSHGNSGGNSGGGGSGHGGSKK